MSDEDEDSSVEEEMDNEQPHLDTEKKEAESEDDDSDEDKDDEDDDDEDDEEKEDDDQEKEDKEDEGNDQDEPEHDHSQVGKLKDGTEKNRVITAEESEEERPRSTAFDHLPGSTILEPWEAEYEITHEDLRAAVQKAIAATKKIKETPEGFRALPVFIPRGEEPSVTDQDSRHLEEPISSESHLNDGNEEDQDAAKVPELESATTTTSDELTPEGKVQDAHTAETEEQLAAERTAQRAARRLQSRSTSRRSVLGSIAHLDLKGGTGEDSSAVPESPLSMATPDTAESETPISPSHPNPRLPQPKRKESEPESTTFETFPLLPPKSDPRFPKGLQMHQPTEDKLEDESSAQSQRQSQTPSETPTLSSSSSSISLTSSPASTAAAAATGLHRRWSVLEDKEIASMKELAKERELQRKLRREASMRIMQEATRLVEGDTSYTAATDLSADTAAPEGKGLEEFPSNPLNITSEAATASQVAAANAEVAPVGRDRAKSRLEELEEEIKQVEKVDSERKQKRDRERKERQARLQRIQSDIAVGGLVPKDTFTAANQEVEKLKKQREEQEREERRKLLEEERRLKEEALERERVLEAERLLRAEREKEEATREREKREQENREALEVQRLEEAERAKQEEAEERERELAAQKHDEQMANTPPQGRRYSDRRNKRQEHNLRASFSQGDIMAQLNASRVDEEPDVTAATTKEQEPQNEAKETKESNPEPEESFKSPPPRRYVSSRFNKVEELQALSEAQARTADVPSSTPAVTSPSVQQEPVSTPAPVTAPSATAAQDEEAFKSPPPRRYVSSRFNKVAELEALAEAQARTSEQPTPVATTPMVSLEPEPTPVVSEESKATLEEHPSNPSTTAPVEVAPVEKEEEESFKSPPPRRYVSSRFNKVEELQALAEAQARTADAVPVTVDTTTVMTATISEPDQGAIIAQKEHKEEQHVPTEPEDTTTTSLPRRRHQSSRFKVYEEHQKQELEAELASSPAHAPYSPSVKTVLNGHENEELASSEPHTVILMTASSSQSTMEITLHKEIEVKEHDEKHESASSRSRSKERPPLAPEVTMTTTATEELGVTAPQSALSSRRAAAALASVTTEEDTSSSSRRRHRSPSPAASKLDSAPASSATTPTSTTAPSEGKLFSSFFSFFTFLVLTSFFFLSFFSQSFEQCPRKRSRCKKGREEEEAGRAEGRCSARQQGPLISLLFILFIFLDDYSFFLFLSSLSPLLAFTLPLEPVILLKKRC